MATARRDTLLELQAKAQKKWAEEKTFEVTAPRDGAFGGTRDRARSREGLRALVTRDLGKPAPPPTPPPPSAPRPLIASPPLPPPVVARA